jgi:hypothetical protein
MPLKGIYKRIRPLCPVCGAPQIQIFPQQWKCISAACNLSIAPTCKCGAKKVMLEGMTWHCIYCDIFHETLYFVYVNHCWNCTADIDSRFCIKSTNPTAGYHCNYCGMDLAGKRVIRKEKQKKYAY